MAATSKTDQKILAAATKLMATCPWPKLTLADIAREASLPIGSVYRIYPSRLAVLCALHREIDGVMLDGTEEEGSPRDRVFDLLMRRFDALASLKPAFKTGLGELRKGRLGTLEAAAVAALGLKRSMSRVLDAAGVSGSCLTIGLRAKILGTVYVAGFRVWLDDDSDDLARTMAALDKALTRASPFLGLSNSQPKAATPEPGPLDPLPA